MKVGVVGSWKSLRREMLLAKGGVYLRNEYEGST